MDLAKFLAGKLGVALKHSLAFIVALAVPPLAAVAGSVAVLVAKFAARFAPRLVTPIVVVIVFSGSHRLAIIFVALRNDAVEPFPDRHAGPASGLAGGFARLWTEASEIPRTARFHCSPKPLPEERGLALS